MNQTPIPDYFLDLIRRSQRGKFKVYIGMSAGVGIDVPNAPRSPRAAAQRH